MLAAVVAENVGGHFETQSTFLEVEAVTQPNI